MGVFGNIGNAKYSEGGVYLGPGVFRLEIVAVKVFKTRKGQQAFCAEFIVHESSNKDHQPGSTCSWMVTLDKEPAMGNIKQFIAAVYETDMDEVTEAVADMVTDEEKNPTKGMFVRASANQIKTRKGGDFTKVKFIFDSAGTAGATKQHAADAA